MMGVVFANLASSGLILTVLYGHGDACDGSYYLRARSSSASTSSVQHPMTYVAEWQRENFFTWKHNECKAINSLHSPAASTKRDWASCP